MTAVNQSLFDNLQHQLRFDELGCPMRSRMKGIADAIAGNPECSIGVMARYGWAYSPKGLISDDDRPEFLILVTRGDCHSYFPDYWYGHVFFLHPENWKSRSGYWVSLLVRTGASIDGNSPDDVLASWRDNVALLHIDPEMQPGYIWNEYASEDDENCTWHQSMEDAVVGLVRKIQRFERLPGSFDL